MRLPPASFLLCVAVLSLSRDARAEDATPSYELPAGIDLPKLDAPFDEAVRRAVATIADPASAEEADDAARVIAGIGRGALPRAVRGLSGSTWYVRSAIFTAIAEMDAPDATPLLVAACRDPSFAVREAAVAGLGKTGDSRSSAALLERTAPETEPVWRVRAAAVTALRRATLRGAVPRVAAESALVRSLDDPDEDVRRTALREAAPLAADAALPALLEVFSDPETQSRDRIAALAALRAYRSPKPELLAALRRGFLSGDDAGEAAEAGRALLAIRGVAALEDEEVSGAIVQKLHESEGEVLREAVAKLGRRATPWLRTQALRLATRIASGKALHGDTSFDQVLDTLFQADEPGGLALVKEILTGLGDQPLAPETRTAALRKIEIAYAPRMQAELRALYDDPKVDTDLRPQILRTIVASGGDDLAERLDAALANPSKRIRREALELLNRRSDLPAGPLLTSLAREAADPVERRAALDTLSRRDAELAAEIAAALLSDPRAEMRSRAITVLSGSEDAAQFDRLVARLAVEDGADGPHPSKPPGGGDVRGTTPSEHATDLSVQRRRLRDALLTAIRLTGGELARPVLLGVAETDPDAFVRKVAVTELRSVALPEDAARLVAIETAEPDGDTRHEMLCTLASLGEAPEAVARFEKLVADSRTRADAVRLLAEKGASVVPASLAAGLQANDWTDDERMNALTALERAGRGPAAERLAALVAESRTLDLCTEAAHVLAARAGPEAAAEIVALLTKVAEPDRLTQVVQALGTRHAPEAEAPLLSLFAATREKAFAAQFSTNPSVSLYVACAEALAEFGSDGTGEAIVRDLFDRRLVHAAARRAAWAHGPFWPDEAAPVTIVRTLVAALARRDEASCRRLVGARLDALAGGADDLALPEGFVAGVARYLEDPLAYKLPERPRPAAASLLWRLVTRIAPRMSAPDGFAWQSLDGQLGQERRYTEARDAIAAGVALADVENAARPPEERLVEQCRIAVRTAQALAASGHEGDALVLARKLREPDPSSAELAYRQGWLLARLSHADAEARDALAFAAGQDDHDPRIHFQLGWVTGAIEGPEPSLRYLREAVQLDRRRAEDRTDDDSAGFGGEGHETAAYPYWFARALRAAGDDDARGFLTVAVSLDDRLAAEARADPGFAGWNGLEAAVIAGLAKIRPHARR